MSTEVSTALVQEYRSNIEVQFQQKRSRLRDAVRVEPQHAEFEFYDRIGPTTPVEVTTRHADTPLIDTPHDRRRVALRDFDWADLIDRKDRIRMLADPTGPYVMNVVYALNRQIDDLIIEAAFGTAYTGKTGAGTQSLPASQVIAYNYDEGTTTNSDLTLAKLRRARNIIDSAEGANDLENDLFIICSPTQIQNLLADATLTSSDYNTVKALVNGEINTFMGFQFIKSNRLLATSDPYTRVIAFERQGLLLALGKDILVDVGPRRDKRNSVQVYACLSAGSVRMWEDKVVEILCNEAWTV